MSVRVRSLDDRHYFRDREEQCRKAAAEATDPSARIAHSQLAEFYARRLAKADDEAEPGADPSSGTDKVPNAKPPVPDPPQAESG